MASGAGVARLNLFLAFFHHTVAISVPLTVYSFFVRYLFGNSSLHKATSISFTACYHWHAKALQDFTHYPDHSPLTLCKQSWNYQINEISDPRDWPCSSSSSILWEMWKAKFKNCSTPLTCAPSVSKMWSTGQDPGHRLSSNSMILANASSLWWNISHQSWFQMHDV